MTEDNRTTESLLARRELASKATPGPWEKDGSCVYTTWSREEYPERGDYVDVPGFAEIRVAETANCIEDEEIKANAAHIATNSPDVVMADIDEILRLRTENEKLRKSVGIQRGMVQEAYQTAALAWGGEIPSPLPGHTHMTEEEACAMFDHLNCPWCGGSGHVDDCDEAGQAVKATLERLEKEADWLALVLANAGCGIPLTEYIGEAVNGMSPPAPEHWREAARKAVETS